MYVVCAWHHNVYYMYFKTCINLTLTLILNSIEKSYNLARAGCYNRIWYHTTLSIKVTSGICY